MTHRHRMHQATTVTAIALALLGIFCLSFSQPARAETLPWNDPAQQGYIALCDGSGHNITSGTLDSVPFAWKAISSAPAPADYQGEGENTVLDIYQPRPDTLPSDWSGDQVTAASFYDQPAHPVAVATSKDLPLSFFVKEFPPLVDGLYQLRMYFAKANYGQYSATYPATTLRVTGNTWQVVQGGSASCQPAATSYEVMMGVATSRQATPPSLSQSGAPAASQASATAAGVPGASQSPGQQGTAAPHSGSRSAAAAAATAGTTSKAVAVAGKERHQADSSGRLLGVIAAVAALLAAAAALLFVRRARSG